MGKFGYPISIVDVNVVNDRNPKTTRIIRKFIFLN